MLGSNELLEDGKRKLLKSLGSWIGALTIGRNKPILIKYLDLKELLIQAYQHGKLLAIIPFTCRIMDSCNTSTVFATSNPWVTAILSLLVEIMDQPDLLMNLAIVIELTFKNLNLIVGDFPRSNLLSGKEIRIRSDDFNRKDPPTPEPED